MDNKHINNDIQITNSNDDVLSLDTIKVNIDYLKEWNENARDFKCLSRNGELLRPTLYRVGGMDKPNIGVDKYFMLLKYVEAYYSDKIMEMSKDLDKLLNKKETTRDNKHLKGVWCILDNKGNEIKTFEDVSSYPNLIKDSCIYSINSRYYHIESGYCYGYTSNAMNSKDYLFLNTELEDDKSKRGILKINKQNGEFELFCK